MLTERINKNRIDPDKPILKEEEDLLGRQPLACSVADLINDIGDEDKDSVVIGIEGEWGSGKSSFINLILNKVRPTEKNLVIEFNPWNFSDQNELIKDFFNSITNALDKIYTRRSLTREFYKKSSKKFKLHKLRPFRKRVLPIILYLPRLLRIDIFIKGLKLLLKWFGVLILWLLLVKRPPKSPSKQIKNYSSKLLRLGEISVDPTISILGIVNIRIGALWKFRHSDNESLGNQRKEIDKFLEKLPRRLVIVIDDIDRLDGEETRLIFKLVKLVADFPNTIFLLAYDREKVGKRMDEWSIRDGDSIEGQEYLKKIVQQPFPLPKPEKDDIYTELLKAIGNELNRIGFDRKQVSDLHWFNLVSFNEPLMELFFNHPRRKTLREQLAS